MSSYEVTIQIKSLLAKIIQFINTVQSHKHFHNIPCFLTELSQYIVAALII